MFARSIRVLLCVAALFVSYQIAEAQQVTARNFSERFIITAMQQLVDAEMTYMAKNGNGNFGSLAELGNEGLVNSALASGFYQGYFFTVEITSADGKSPSDFQIYAIPHIYRRTGIRSFYADSSGIIRGEDLGGDLAGSDSPEIDACVLWGNSDNERCTIEDIRLVHGSQITFAATYGYGNFGSFAELHNLGLIPWRVALGFTRGYLHVMEVRHGVKGGLPPTFRMRSTPQIYGVTGIRSFCIDQTGILRGADKGGKPADENDPPIDSL